MGMRYADQRGHDTAWMTAEREATEAEAEEWRAEFTDGYRAGRGDAIAGRGPRDGWLLASVPAELPFETGAQYVARCLPDARRIGYTRAWRFAVHKAGHQ